MKNLETPYELSAEQINFYQKNRFIKLKNVFDANTLAYYNDLITKEVTAMNTVTTKVEERDTYGKAFLQLFNLWRENAEVKTFVFSKRLAKIAADLMQCEGVRMYHDQEIGRAHV